MAERLDGSAIWWARLAQSGAELGGIGKFPVQLDDNAPENTVRNCALRQP
ncbi:hypothetical protein LMG29542_07830 [Paraburkholderia humisilvae]|uniref:Uncharacterized protein n=1 Tax=Paraburkholderia humisilvae TaxID=627669 RepID=A0A6J5F7V1_9BURK|nr:hypothetical protein LMG29542_07830 [Paraburkholderia humisilvae]